METLEVSPIIQNLRFNTLWRILKYTDPGKKELARIGIF